MQDLYETFGYYRNATLSFTFEGADGARAMDDLLDSLRRNPLQEIAGLPVEHYLDYETGVGSLPVANVLEFDLAHSNKVIVRPSGTEPKVKIYLFAVGKTAQEADEFLTLLSQEMNAFMEK